MQGTTQFAWKGKPIKDIQAWCKDNNTKMIRVKWSRRVPNLFAARIDDEEYEEEIPESFYECLQMRDGWFCWRVDESISTPSRTLP